MAYENTVEAFIRDYGVGYQSRKGRAMTEMHKHLLGAAFQLAAFRDALAIARQARCPVCALAICSDLENLFDTGTCKYAQDIAAYDRVPALGVLV